MWGINMNNGGQQSQAPKEFVTLYSIGGKGKLQELVHDAMLHSLNKDKEKTIIFVLDQMHGSVSFIYLPLGVVTNRKALCPRRKHLVSRACPTQEIF
jgi:hypothetical protein